MSYNNHLEDFKFAIDTIECEGVMEAAGYSSPHKVIAIHDPNPATPMPSSWGNWSLNRDALTLVFADGVWSVDLSLCRNAAQVLRQITEFATKVYPEVQGNYTCHAIDLADLVKALAALFHLTNNEMCERSCEELAAAVRRIKRFGGNALAEANMDAIIKVAIVKAEQKILELLREMGPDGKHVRWSHIRAEAKMRDSALNAARYGLELNGQIRRVHSAPITFCLEKAAA